MNNPPTTEQLKAILLAEIIKIIRILEELATSRKFWALAGSLAAIWSNQHAGGIAVTDALWMTVTALGAYAAATGLENIGDAKPKTTVTETTQTAPSTVTSVTVETPTLPAGPVSAGKG